MQIREEGGLQHHVGYLIDIWVEIARENGFEYSLYKTEDGQYGSQKENSSDWTGTMLTSSLTIATR